VDTPSSSCARRCRRERCERKLISLRAESCREHDRVPVVEVGVRAAELPQRTTEMRAWLARHGAPATEIAYTKESSRAIVRVTLATLGDADTFAKRFGGRIVED
jgi:hypothetical protein